MVQVFWVRNGLVRATLKKEAVSIITDDCDFANLFPDNPLTDDCQSEPRH